MPIQDISIDEYQEKFDADTDFVLVDVREPEEYTSGHLPGAVNIPLNSLPLRIAEIATDKPVVLVCARGSRSAMAAEFMEAQGYPDLYNLEDGTIGWMIEGLPLETE